MAAALPAVVYPARTDMEYKLSSYGVVGALDDNADGDEDITNGASTPWIAQALNHGTNRVNMFLMSKYTAAELALSPIACEWAVIHACKWLLGRRGNPIPAGLASECTEADAMMKEIQQGKAILPDAAPISSTKPSHLNVRIDRNFRYAKQRIIRPESDQSSTDHPQQFDYGAEVVPYR